MNKLKVIGTNHLMNKQEIYKILDKENPTIICLEFCKTRFELMVQNPQPQQEVKDDSVLGKISKAIKKKAEEEKLEYGGDMINASKYALENDIKLEFLDLDIAEIKRLFNLIPENEKQGFMVELMEFENKSLTQEINAEDTLNQLKSKYPVAYEFLITLRDTNIIKNILKVYYNNPNCNIVCLVGKGHLNQINKELGLIYE